MSLTPSAAMADFVHRRMNALLRKPDGWGPPHAVELQALLLVEMWHVVRGASKERVDGVVERYERFLGGVLPGPPLPLALRLGLHEESSPRFVEVLRDFVRREQQLERDTDHRPVAQAPPLPANDDELHPVAEA